MQALFPIPKQLFGAEKLKIVSAINNIDYNHDFHDEIVNTHITHVDEQFARKYYLNPIITKEEQANTIYPFNLFALTVQEDQSGLEEGRVRVETVANPSYHCMGYHANHTEQLYFKMTSSSNTWGVFKKNDEYFFFINAFRAATKQYMSSEVWNYLVSNDIKPIYTNSKAPSDMKWHEEQYDYLVRKGLNNYLDYITSYDEYQLNLLLQGEINDNGHIVRRYGYFGENEGGAYEYFLDKYPNLNELIIQKTLGNPEQYLLNRYRNKKFKPENLTGKDLIAWDMLPQDVKDRLVKWG